MSVETRYLRLSVLVMLMACGDDSAALDAGRDAPADTSSDAADASIDTAIDTALDAPMDPSRFVDPSAYEYDWTCSGEVAPTGGAPDADPPTEDCSEGVWPDLDVTVLACPTVTDVMRDDPVSGMTLPLPDERELPLEIPVSESGSFIAPDAPSTWPETLRVVAWNMEYSSNLDAQIDSLVDDPELGAADVYLLSEVDRCSTRNGVRRAARLLAERVQGDYVYGIEFVELSIGRDIGGDTGQAIVSRRPITGASLLCHSSQFDWFETESEPRLGQRVVLHADIPAGDTEVRVWAVHFESNDAFGERRAVQAKELLDASQARACDRPQIVAGDFNAWYGAAPELVVFRANDFLDAMAELGDTESTHDSGRRLDYMFARGFEITGGAVLRDVHTSDHFPLWVDLRVNAGDT